MLLWTSGPGARDYTRSTHQFGSVQFPSGIASRLADANNNQVPDSIENMSIEARKAAYTTMTQSNTQNKNFVHVDEHDGQLNIGFDEQSADALVDATQNLLDGLSCGFGGGSCLNSPINWAPLAP